MRLSVYHIDTRPYGHADLRRGWDGGLYLEFGIAGEHPRGFGPPPAGPDQPFELQGDKLVRSTVREADGRIHMYPHQPVVLEGEALEALRAL